MIFVYRGGNAGIANGETYRDRQGQTGTSRDRKGQTETDRDRQGQARTDRNMQGQKGTVPACPCLTLALTGIIRK